MAYVLACLEGLEPPTYWFVASHSIQLSYRHVYRTVFIIPRHPLFVKLFFQFFQKKLHGIKKTRCIGI